MRRSFLSLTLVVCVLLTHVRAQVIHTAHDHIPDFAIAPTVRSAAAGAWSSPSTWAPARVPGPNDVVLITHDVRYDSMTGDVDVIGVAAGGTLRWSTTQSTRLSVGTLQFLPGSTFEIGSPSSPLPPTITAEIVFKDQQLNPAIDPDQYGTGLLGIDSVVRVFGSVKSPTWVRLAVEPRAGHLALSLEAPVAGWRVGDRILLPDTRQVGAGDWFNPAFQLEVEERTITAISGGGYTLWLDAALSFDHRGARDADGTPTVLPSGIKLLPHVANLSRNIVFRSANPNGTRAHILFTRRADVKINYAQLQDLGRTRAIPLNAQTNHIGRYPLHIHHVWGPLNPTNTGYQFEVVGNAINDSLKWPLAVHGSHFGLIKQNVINGGSQLTGAGIAVEDGSETENLFERNFVANIRGSLNARLSGPGTADGTTPGSAAECYWGNGFNNRWIGNVATTCRNPVQEIVAGPGFKFIVPPAPYQAAAPRFRGADMTDPAQTTAVVSQNRAILEFRDNEVYGIASVGFTAWQLGTDGYTGFPSTQAPSVIQDLRVWHTYEAALWDYPFNRLTIDGLHYRIDGAVTSTWFPAISSGDYRAVNLTVRDGTIHAGSVLGEMLDPVGTTIIEGVDAVVHDAGFIFQTPATPGTLASRNGLPVTAMVLRNNRVRPWPGTALRTIKMFHTLQYAAASRTDLPYQVFVYDYQQQPGVEFRAFFHEQATQNLYGGIAPCANTTARPEVDGITCAMFGSPPPQPGGSTPPLPATNLRITR